MMSVLRSRARQAAGLLVAAVSVVAPVGALNVHAAPAQPDSSAGVTAEAVAGEYVVLLRSGRTGTAARQGADDLSARIDAVMSRLDDTYGRSAVSSDAVVTEELAVVDGFAARLSRADAALLATDSDVMSVEPNIEIERSVDPTVNPTSGSVELPWGLDRIDQPALPLDGSYSPPGDGAGVTAYVVDDGVWAEHAEFADRVKPLVDFVGDAPSVDKIVTECMAHGTHVAGTIAGTTVGVAPGATIQPVRVLGCGGGHLIDVLRGLDWVYQNADLPAVANMSLGGQRSAALNSAVGNLTAKGISVVVAAGNEGQDACSTSPASALPAISVGASSDDDRTPTWSNFGPCVDLYAPGLGVVSASVDGVDKYMVLSGTSMASPHVAGTAALYLGAHPTANPAAVEQAILAGSATGVLDAIRPDSPNKLLQVDDLPDPTNVADNTPVARITPPAGTGPIDLLSDVTLDGGDSYDPQGGALTYEWRVQDQEDVAGTDPSLTVTVDHAPTFAATLKVTNESGVTNITTMEFEVEDPHPPAVLLDPGELIIVANEGDLLSWDASESIDYHGGDLSFEWLYLSFGKETSGVGPTFETTYGFGGGLLIVVATNEYGGQSMAQVAVTDPIAPVAVITPAELHVRVGESFLLSGRGSYDDAFPWKYLDFEWTDSSAPGEVLSTDSEYVTQFDDPGTYTVTLKVTSLSGETATKTASVRVSKFPPAMTSIDPVRVLDTRVAHPEAPGPKGTVGAGKMVKVGVGSVPGSATGVMLNVTAVAPGGDGHLTVYPCGKRPNTSNLNYSQGETRGNTVLAMFSGNHELCIWTLAAADVVVDVTGYIGDTEALDAVPPVRAYDSRRVGTKVPAGGVVEVPIYEDGYLSSSYAVFVNLAVAAPSADGHLTAYPCGADLPPTSSLNYQAGVTGSSLAIVELSDDAKICIRSHAETDVIVDVLGHVRLWGHMVLTSDRTFDTRSKYTKVAPTAKGALAAGETVRVKLDVDPAETAGVYLNVTAVAPQGDGHLTVYPCGDLPKTSGLNYAGGVTTSNMLFAKVDDTGSVCIRTHAATDLVVDYEGWVVDGLNPATVG